MRTYIWRGSLDALHAHSTALAHEHGRYTRNQRLVTALSHTRLWER